MSYRISILHEFHPNFKDNSRQSLIIPYSWSGFWAFNLASLLVLDNLPARLQLNQVPVASYNAS